MFAVSLISLIKNCFLFQEVGGGLDYLESHVLYIYFKLPLEIFYSHKKEKTSTLKNIISFE